MLDFIILVLGLGQPDAWFGTTFDRARLAAGGTFWNQIAGDEFKKFVVQLLLFLERTGLRNGRAKLTQSIDRSFKAQLWDFDRMVPAGLDH
jgi:hypothetical protein